MSLRPLNLLRRGLAGLWWLIDVTRRTLLNLLFLLLVAAVLFAMAKRETPSLQDNTALVLALEGPLVEEMPGSVRDNAIARLGGESMHITRLRDVLAVLESAATDPQITRVVLMLDDFQGAGLASLREVADALERFKASGKPVVAWGSGYNQKQYYLASHASEVLMHPLGAVYLDGYGHLRNYYREALDKLGVGVSLVRVGTFKSAAEPFIANGPSEAATRADTALYGALWATYTEGIEHARQLPPGSTQALIDALPERLKTAGGDGARLALEAHQVDALKTRVVGGESHFGRNDLRPFFEHPSTPILQPDPMRGGFSELRKIAAAAEPWGIRIAPHLFHETMVHVMASIPNANYLEYMDWNDDLWVEPVLPSKNGTMSPPERPGHGLAFRPEILKDCRIGGQRLKG